MAVDSLHVFQTLSDLLHGYFIVYWCGMICIAVTGGIACGKSLAGSYLASVGWAVCEADQVAHALYVPGGPAYDQVRALAGEDAVRTDGTIDRQKLAQKVFAAPALLEALNATLHPFVKQELAKWLQACEQQGFSGAATIVPLLFEAGMQAGWDAVVCIGCRAAVQRQRLAARGLNASEIDRRIDAQWPIEQKMAAADFAIWNDGSQQDLQGALDDVVGRVSERK